MKFESSQRTVLLWEIKFHDQFSVAVLDSALAFISSCRDTEGELSPFDGDKSHESRDGSLSDESGSPFYFCLHKPPREIDFFGPEID